jgi:flagellar biosynthesis protein FlhB
MPSDRRTEPATPRRLRKARRAGDHPVSRPLVGFGALALLLIFAPSVLEELERGTRESLAGALAGAPPQVTELALRVGQLAGPLLGAAALGALCMGAWQTRGVLSIEPLRWDLGRLNPLGRAGPGLAARTLSLGLGLASALAICVAGWIILKGLGAVLANGIGDADAALSLATESCRRLGYWALGVCLALGSVDALLCYVQWLRRHRMTLDEVRNEQREDQGDPELRQARRQLHRELSRSATSLEIAQADLLVLGAPRLAVALRYDPHRDVAPRVIASGGGAVAASLEALATRYGVPIEHDTALARALAAVPEGEPIPKARYGDIALALQRAGLFRLPS